MSPKSNGPTEETVVSVTHFTDRLFKFQTTRPQAFRFRSGEFVMIGLPPEQEGDKPIMRAYSIASPAWDETLEFYSIKVPDGPLTSRLQKITVGDKILLARKTVGTLVHDALLPGKRLFLFCTGTGFAPFASILRDPETYEKFEQIIVVHTCRLVAELTYSRDMIAALPDDPLIGETIGDKVRYLPTTTREPSATMGRVTTLLESGDLYRLLEIPPLNPATDRAMICGSLPMTLDTKALMEQAGLTEGSNAKPAEFVIEKAFVG